MNKRQLMDEMYKHSALLAEMRELSFTGSGAVLNVGDNGLLVAAFDAMQAEIARLRYVLATEASYCMGHADKLRGVDPERSARHEARAKRLLDAMEG